LAFSVVAPAGGDAGHNTGMQEVDVYPKSPERLTPLIGGERAERLRLAVAKARQAIDGATVWHVNATAHGGGVAEILTSLLAYGQGAGLDSRWLALDGDDDFFALTKRIHNLIHGTSGDGGPVGPTERQHYERVLNENLAELRPQLRPGDVVLLHDPQTAGLIPGLRDFGVFVGWRSHIGADTVNQHTDHGWAFLRPYVEQSDAVVFSRLQFVPDWVPSGKVTIIEPSIDPLATKNLDLDADQARAVLAQARLLTGARTGGDLSFRRSDGAAGKVRRHDDLLVGGAAPPAEARLAVQVSRWDRLKDMSGVLHAFTEHLDAMPDDTHLMLVGPAVDGVSDDPEGAAVLAECTELWHRLPRRAQERSHLVTLPMDDLDENAHLTNAIRHHATVLLQKSLVEGFGLTVTEALWRARPVIASAIGGITDQITNGVEGLLLPDPGDLNAFANTLAELFYDDERAGRLGQAGRARVQDQFLVDRDLIQFANWLEERAGNS
jgi:trehalose synthase